MPTNQSQAWRKRARTIGRLAFVLSLIVGTWVFSLYLVRRAVAARPNLADQASTLFGAAQVSLFILSVHIGIVAVLGWQFIEGMIRRAVEEVTNKRLEILENELRGRSFAIQGYLMGEDSIEPDYSKWKNSKWKDEEHLREALFYCEQGYQRLKNSGLPAEFMALNNLLAYSCALGDKWRRGYLLDGARCLRAAAEEHGSPNLLLTYCHTILEFSLDPKELDEACLMVVDIGSNPSLDAKQKREADFLASRCRNRSSGEPWR
jgi:hypothetical protein